MRRLHAYRYAAVNSLPLNASERPPVTSANGRLFSQPLHHLVLIHRDLRLVVVPYALQEVARVFEPFRRALQLVVRETDQTV